MYNVHKFVTALPADAGFSASRSYRYWLSRCWNKNGRLLVVVGLNPSTADEHKDDLMIRKCIGFAKRWGFGKLAMVNMFAWRATRPDDMFAQYRPIGPRNDYWLQAFGDAADGILAAWGKHQRFLPRVERVMAFLPEMKALAVNVDGSPRHPLYMPYGCHPTLYELGAAQRVPLTSKKGHA